MKYTVEIIETLCRQIKIEANSKEEAAALGKELYRDEKIVLGADDLIGDAEIKVL